jgi:hypothetical protein
MDRHHVDGLAGLAGAGLGAGLGELVAVLPDEFFRVVVRNDIAFAVEQIAVAVALVDGAEVPAMAVIIGELGVLRRRSDSAAA